MTTIAGQVASGTDILIPKSGKELEDFRAAKENACEINKVTVELADAYRELFGVAFPADYIGMPYSRLLGSAFDPTLALRAEIE